jgi:hypothetical protein
MQRTGTSLVSTPYYHPVRLAYQPPTNSIFLSEETNHQQPASSTFLSKQTSTGHQSPANKQYNYKHVQPTIFLHNKKHLAFSLYYI